MSPAFSLAAKRRLRLTLAVASAAAIVGFFTGTRHAPTPGGYHRQGADSAAQSARLAPKQRDVEASRYADRRAIQQSALQAMALPPRGVNDPVTLDPNEYVRDVTERASGRAYDGAPPTIPHAVDQFGAPACLSCHERGMMVEGKLASPMSHEPYASCLQCHATREAGSSAQQMAQTVSESNSFAGLASSGHGPRAWPSAPPQIPHRSFMRERCTSCHGVWAQGIASSHASRQSCTQCHTPAASVDQMPRSTFAPLGQLVDTGDSTREQNSEAAP